MQITRILYEDDLLRILCNGKNFIHGVQKILLLITAVQFWEFLVFFNLWIICKLYVDKRDVERTDNDPTFQLPYHAHAGRKRSAGTFRRRVYHDELHYVQGDFQRYYHICGGQDLQ